MMFEAIGWANRVKRSKNVCNAHALFSPNEFHAHQYIPHSYYITINDH